MFPPKNTLYLFFVNKWAIILHVVDLPLVPVTTILLKGLLIKKNKSISVIIFSLYLLNLFLLFCLFKFIPGLKII